MIAAIDPRKLALIGLAVVALLLVGSLVAVLGLSAPDPVKPSADSLEAMNISLPEALPDGGQNFVERPLFWASRRPLGGEELVPESADAGAKRVPTATARALDEVRVVGLYAIPGGTSGAILSVDGKRRRASVGDMVRGWTLKEVRGDVAVFSGTVFRGEDPVNREVGLEHALVGARADAKP